MDKHKKIKEFIKRLLTEREAAETKHQTMISIQISLPTLKVTEINEKNEKICGKNKSPQNQLQSQSDKMGFKAERKFTKIKIAMSIKVIEKQIQEKSYA